MNLTMAQLYTSRAKGNPGYTRDVAQIFLALDAAIAKAVRHNPFMNTDDVLLATLGIVQKLCDRRMNEWISGVAHGKIHQPKANRLTGFLD